jgi:hypothetical protein
VLETGEVCDGAQLGGQTCGLQGFDGGTIACSSDCLSFDTSNCWNNECSDTDGGMNYMVQGTVSGTRNGFDFDHTDSCNETILTEWYCSGDNPTDTTYVCGGNFTGCTNGACS